MEPDKEKAKGVNAYWAFYQELYYQMRYYEHYKTRSHRLNVGIIVLLLASSMAGVSGLWFWEKFPKLWSIIAATIQIVSASTFLMPYSEQIWALGRLLPELDCLINRVDRDWNTVDTKDSQAIFNLIFSYKQEQLSIEQRYTSSVYLPASNHCRKLAQKDREDFNAGRFRIKPKERIDENARTNTATSSQPPPSTD